MSPVWEYRNPKIGKGRVNVGVKIHLQGIMPTTDVGLADFDNYIRADMARLEPLLATIGRSN